MLVYDFKNVAKIKNLKNSESVKSEHAERIAEIPDSIVKDFDIEKYKSNPPHKNESMRTIYELINISQIPSDDEFTLKMDEVTQSFKDLCEQLSVDFPKDKVVELGNVAGSIILNLKYHYNRPRPYMLAKEFEIPLDTNKIKNTTADSPSYPSGHAAQGILISNYLAEINPSHKMEFIKLGKDIARSRIVAKVHYPSDVRFGEIIGNDIFIYLNKNELI